jgi:hypothetical protein
LIPSDCHVQILAAEQVELERIEFNLGVAASSCDTRSRTPANETSPVDSSSTCGINERRAIANLRRTIKTELETRTRLNVQAQQRKQYACLWSFRGSPLTEAVAQILTSSSFDGAVPSLQPTPIGDVFGAMLSKARSTAPVLASDGSLDVGAAHATHLSRVLEVCTALTAPAFAAGAPLRECLCTEAEKIHLLTETAATSAQMRAVAAANATRASSENAVVEAQKKLDSDRAAREVAKERLFTLLQSQPEYARIVADAMRPTVPSLTAGSAASASSADTAQHVL